MTTPTPEEPAVEDTPDGPGTADPLDVRNEIAESGLPLMDFDGTGDPLDFYDP